MLQGQEGKRRTETGSAEIESSMAVRYLVSLVSGHRSRHLLQVRPTHVWCGPGPDGRGGGGRFGFQVAFQVQGAEARGQDNSLMQVQRPGSRNSINRSSVSVVGPIVCMQCVPWERNKIGPIGSDLLQTLPQLLLPVIVSLTQTAE
jgi:hypothetical protein